MVDRPRAPTTTRAARSLSRISVAAGVPARCRVLTCRSGHRFDTRAACASRYSGGGPAVGVGTAATSGARAIQSGSATVISSRARPRSTASCAAQCTAASEPGDPSVPTMMGLSDLVITHLLAGDVTPEGDGRWRLAPTAPSSSAVGVVATGTGLRPDLDA